MMRVWRLSLSVAYIRPKSRTERPGKTKIGTEVAHVTRDSGTTRSKGQRSTCRGRGHIVAASRTACWYYNSLHEVMPENDRGPEFFETRCRIFSALILFWLASGYLRETGRFREFTNGQGLGSNNTLSFCGLNRHWFAWVVQQNSSFLCLFVCVSGYCVET